MNLEHYLNMTKEIRQHQYKLQRRFKDVILANYDFVIGFLVLIPPLPYKKDKPQNNPFC